jgi:hypothetical protein
MKAVAIAIFFSVWLAGCESESYWSAQERDKSPQKSITNVVSEPSGARIEVDNNYIGNAPIDITWNDDNSGYFTSYHTVKATPLYHSQQPQSKSFSLGEKIPPTIFFDLNRAQVKDHYQRNDSQ